MSRKPAIPRQVVTRDIQDILRYYLQPEDGQALALRFIEAFQTELKHVEEFPAIGSPRLGEQLSLPGLRSIQMPGIPYIVFYEELDQTIDVWRILHARRDLPAYLISDDLGDGATGA